MKFYFVRHGESEANILNIISNRGNQHGLSPRGCQQALTLATQLKSERASWIYSSPLRRAVQTAAILSDYLGIPYEIVDALREYDCGILEGCSDAVSWQLHRQVKEAWLKHQVWDCRIKKGESFLDIKERFIPFIERLIYPSCDDTKKFILVGHGGIFMCMLPLILKNIDFAFVLEQPFPNTGYVLAELTDIGLICLEWCGVPLKVRSGDA